MKVKKMLFILLKIAYGIFIFYFTYNIKDNIN